MPRRNDLLERIRIPTPCEADWDSMAGNDRVRFCAHCELNVTDLSSMTRGDARRLVRESEGRLCVRYYRAPDGSLITAPSQRLQQIARRASKLAAGAFGAALTLGASVAAQTGTHACDAAQNAERPARVRADVGEAREGGSASLTGTVFDRNGAVIPGAAVTLNGKGTERSVVTDGQGVYRFESLPAGTYSLTAAAAGFATAEVEGVELQQGAWQMKDATLEVQGPQEQVEVRAEVETQEGATGGVVAFVRPSDPLVKAAFQDDLKAVKELLALGADANVLDKDADTTALAQAVEHGDAEMVSALVGAGADVNLRDGTGQTALMSMNDDTPADIPRALLSAGAKVNVKDKDGDTALTHAAGRVKEDVLRVLIEAGAKVNAKNKDGQTALMEAAREGLVENVRALLLAGADINSKNKDGDTALKLARDNDQEEAAGLLAAFGAAE